MTNSSPRGQTQALLHVYRHASEALGTNEPLLALVEATDVGVGRHGRGSGGVGSGVLPAASAGEVRGRH